MPKPNYSQTDWISKEKRELFCKAVNSMLMTTPDMDLKDVLERSRIIINTAFENYPDKEEEAKGEDVELPTKKE